MFPAHQHRCRPRQKEGAVCRARMGTTWPQLDECNAALLNDLGLYGMTMSRNGRRLLFARLVLAAVLTAGATAALADTKDESQNTGITDPVPTNGDAPSRAVGATHSCAGFYPERERRIGEAGDVLVG